MNECVIAEFKEKEGERILRITQDIEPIDPRGNDNLGIMLCFHKRYNLGDKIDVVPESFSDWNEVSNYLVKEEKAVVVLPLFLYDHSGLTMKVGSFDGLLAQGHAEFDSGQVGFIYVTKEKLKEEKVTKKSAKETLYAEVEAYNQFLRGDVYSFVVVKKTKCDKCDHEDEEVLDSCCGFFGSDFESNGLYEASGVDLKKFEETT